MSNTVVVAIVAVVGSLGGLLVGKLWDRSAEHKRWLQERRGDAYAQFLAMADEVYLHESPAHAIPEEQSLDLVQAREENRRGLGAAIAQVEVFGSWEASDQANRMMLLLTNKADRFPSSPEWSQTVTRFVVQCRDDLNVSKHARPAAGAHHKVTVTPTADE